MKSSVRNVLIILSMIVDECISEEVPFKCGQRPLEEFRKKDELYQNNIDYFYGKEVGRTSPGQWPWMGTVYHRKAGRKLEFVCGCTLISETHVLVEKKCTLDETGSSVNIGSILVRLGTHHQNVLNLGNARFRKVQSIHRPPEDLASGDYIYLNDVWILELNKNVTFNEYVQPVCLVYLLYDLYFSEFGYTVEWDLKRNFAQSTFYFGSSINYIVIYFKKGWHLKYFISNLKDDNVVTVFWDWVSKVTNLHYLPKKIVGQNYNSSQQYPSLLPRRHCGIGLIDERRTTEKANLFEFPWLVQLLGTFDDSLQYYCIGTLISHRYVLTTDACILWVFPVIVRMGEFTLNTNPDCNTENPHDCAPPTTDYEIEYAVVYPKTDNYSNPSQSITLLRTKNVIFYHDHIQPVCLPILSDFRKLNSPQYTIAAWDMKAKNIIKDTIDAESREIFTFQEGIFNCSKNNYDYINGAPIGSFIESHSVTRFVQVAVLIGEDIEDVYAITPKCLSIFPYIDWIIANMQV